MVQQQNPSESAGQCDIYKVLLAEKAYNIYGTRTETGQVLVTCLKRTEWNLTFNDIYGVLFCWWYSLMVSWVPLLSAQWQFRAPVIMKFLCWNSIRDLCSQFCTDKISYSGMTSMCGHTTSIVVNGCLMCSSISLPVYGVLSYLGSKHRHMDTYTKLYLYTLNYQLLVLAQAIQIPMYSRSCFL